MPGGPLSTGSPVRVTRSGESPDSASRHHCIRMRASYPEDGLESREVSRVITRWNRSNATVGASWAWPQAMRSGRPWNSGARLVRADRGHRRGRAVRAAARRVDRRHLDGPVPGREPDRVPGVRPDGSVAAVRPLVSRGAPQQPGPLLRHRGHRLPRRYGDSSRPASPTAARPNPTRPATGRSCGWRPVPLFFAATRARPSPGRATARARPTARPRPSTPADTWPRSSSAPCGGPRRRSCCPITTRPAPGLWDEEPLAPRIAEIASGSFRRRDPPEIRGTGYVVHSLEAALWAFDRSSSFREGALLAVNLGDDADTTGAVFGQLAGAYHGEAGIPREWRERLAMGDLIASMAERLFAPGTHGPSPNPGDHLGKSRIFLLDVYGSSL